MNTPEHRAGSCYSPGGAPKRGSPKQGDGFTATQTEGEQWFRHIAERVPGVFWIADPELKQIHYISPAYEQVWGRSCQSLYERPMSFLDAVHPEDRERVLAIISARMESGEFDAEYRIVRPDGAVRWVWDRAFPIRNKSGSVVRVAGMAEDVTERKQLELDLRRSEAQLAEARVLAHLGNWEWDVPAGALTWSAEIYRILGVDPQTFRPTHEKFLACVHPADRPALKAALEDALSGRSPYAIEFRIFQPNGAERFVGSRGVVITDPAGRPVCMFGTGQDITERRHAEEQLRQLPAQLLRLRDEEQRRLARELHDTTVQHLAAIMLNLGFVQTEARTLAPQAKQALRDSMALVDRATRELRTITYLLHPPLLEELGLAGAVRDFVQGFARRSGIRTSLEIAPELRRMPEEMEIALFRVVQESLTNVHRHSGGKSAGITLKQTAVEIQLEVRDWGHGFLVKTSESAEPPALLGVGIPGMRERLLPLGGRLEITSNTDGTIVRATVPIAMRI